MAARSFNLLQHLPGQAGASSLARLGLTCLLAGMVAGWAGVSWERWRVTQQQRLNDQAQAALQALQAEVATASAEARRAQEQAAEAKRHIAAQAGRQRWLQVLEHLARQPDTQLTQLRLEGTSLTLQGLIAPERFDAWLQALVRPGSGWHAPEVLSLAADGAAAGGKAAAAPAAPAARMHFTVRLRAGALPADPVPGAGS